MELATIPTPNITTNSSDELNSSAYYPTSPIGPDFFDVYNWYLYVMIVFGVVGNFIVIVVFVRHPPSTTTDWFIIFITACDFISSLINVPVYATFTNGYWIKYGTTLICRLHMFISQSLVLSSSFLICGLALDRYIKVCKPLISYSKARARNVCLIISGMTIALSTPCFIMYENRGGRCVSVVMDTHLFVYYFMVFLIFIFAAVVVVFSYYKVTKAVLNSEKNLAGHKGVTQSTTACCVLFPSYRQNKIGPASDTITRSGVFRDTVVPANAIESSTNSANMLNKNRLQVSNTTPHQRGEFLQPPASVSSLIVEPVSNTSLNPSTNVSRGRGTSLDSKQRSKTDSRPISLRTTRISFLVCSVFIVTWIPPWLSFILSSISGMKANIEVVKFMIFGRMTYLVNGMTNPIIYTWLNKKFRRHILDIFCRRKC